MRKDCAQTCPKKKCRNTLIRRHPVDTEGETIGQVNGLSVVNVGDYAFGQPSRITARTFLGEKGM